MLKKIKFFFTILCIAASIASNGQDTAAWIQSFKASENPRGKAVSAQKMGKYYLDSAGFERGIYWALQGLPYALKAKNDSVLWKHYDLLASLYDNSLNFDESIKYMLLSLELKKKNNNLKQMAGTYNDLGVVYGEKTELLEQAGYYLKAKKIYDRIGDTYEADMVAMNLAGVYAHQGFYQKSINAYHELIPRFIANDYVSWLCDIYTRMGACFMSLNKEDSTFYYSDLEIDAAFNSWNYEMNSFNAWSRRVLYCNSFKNYKNYKQAIDSMMHYAGMAKGDINWGDYYEGIARYHLTMTKEYDSALLFLLKAKDNAVLHEDKQTLMRLCEETAEAYASKHDFANAYQSLQSAYALKDSIVTSDGRQQFADMLTKYETEKKEAKIALLNKDNKLKQRTTYFLIVGLALFAIALISLFRNNKLKQKNNSKLKTLNLALDEANQSKVRLFSILSHDLRSPVSNLYSYLQLKKTAPKMLSAEKRQEKEEQLYQSAGHLLNTMEDLLIWSKSQLENFIPDLTEVAISPLLENVLNIYREAIIAKHIRLEMPQQDMEALTDENMLQTILRNVVSNAVKYTPQAGIIRISFNNAGKEIQVFNNGIPIDEPATQRIFDWSNINSQSSGYGLKLSKVLANKLNIDMAISPQPDGNLFIIRFNKNH